MSTEQSPADPRHNITAQELARDVLSLHLPARDLVATDEECAALYAPGVYEQLLKDSGSPAGPLTPAPPHAEE